MRLPYTIKLLRKCILLIEKVTGIKQLRLRHVYGKMVNDYIVEDIKRFRKTIEEENV